MRIFAISIVLVMLTMNVALRKRSEAIKLLEKNYFLIICSNALPLKYKITNVICTFKEFTSHQ